MKARSDIENLLVNLINIESVSGNEKEIADYICTQLNDFSITKQRVAKNRYNICAKKGKTDIWLVVHMDTVPGQIPLKITEEKIYGRGSIDNKGNIAGAIIASKNLKDINLLFTVGEEVDFVGAQKANIKGKVIVMEPTEFKLRTKQCGVIVFKINTFGIQKHSSLKFTEKENANHQMIRILNKLLDFKWSNFNVGALSGGIAANVVSGKSTIECSVRPRNMNEYTNILKQLKKMNNKNIQIMNAIAPYNSSLTLLNANTEPASFFSELSFFENGVLFGVGSIKQAHTKDEYVKRSDLNNLPTKLIALINTLKTTKIGQS